MVKGNLKGVVDASQDVKSIVEDVDAIL